MTVSYPVELMADPRVEWRQLTQHQADGVDCLVCAKGPDGWMVAVGIVVGGGQLFAHEECVAGAK